MGGELLDAASVAERDAFLADCPGFMCCVVSDFMLLTKVSKYYPLTLEFTVDSCMPDTALFLDSGVAAAFEAKAPQVLRYSTIILLKAFNCSAETWGAGT
jgi:hypothetical protein